MKAETVPAAKHQDARELRMVAEFGEMCLRLYLAEKAHREALTSDAKALLRAIGVINPTDQLARVRVAKTEAYADCAALLKRLAEGPATVEGGP